MGSLIVFAVLIISLVVVLGFEQLTQATLGVGVIGICCFGAIVLRMFQAEVHHRRVLAALQGPAAKELNSRLVQGQGRPAA